MFANSWYAYPIRSLLCSFMILQILTFKLFRKSHLLSGYHKHSFPPVMNCPGIPGPGSHTGSDYFKDKKIILSQEMPVLYPALKIGIAFPDDRRFHCLAIFCSQSKFFEFIA
jgi:hypothetical protein